VRLRSTVFVLGFGFVVLSVFWPAFPVAAQEVAGLEEARAVASCVHAHDEAIQRFLRLIEQAEQRARASEVAADVRRDAITSIEALVERIRDRAQQLRQCLEEVRIPARTAAAIDSLPSDPAHDSLASERGTVHEIETDTPIATQVRVVRGERVDGTGRAPDEHVRAAVRGLGGRLAQCYEQYLARGARRSFEIHLAFTAEHGGRVGRGRVEQGASDPGLVRCIEQATEGMRIVGQRGRAVYAYVIRLGSD
jgi:hypothetical protein